MDSLRLRPFTTAAASSMLPPAFGISLSVGTTATTATASAAPIGKRSSIGRGLLLEFAGLPDAYLRAVLQPIRAVDRNHFTDLEPALDVRARLVGGEHLYRPQMRGMVFVNYVDKRPQIGRASCR